MHNTTLNIKCLSPEVAQKKTELVQSMINVLNVETLEYLSEICAKKGTKINAGILSNKWLIDKTL